MSNVLKNGSKVIYRGQWGKLAPKETTIIGIEYCENGSAYGEPISAVTKENYLKCTFDLSDGSWCYGFQIEWDDSIMLNNK